MEQTRAERPITSSCLSTPGADSCTSARTVSAISGTARSQNGVRESAAARAWRSTIHKPSAARARA